MHPRMRALQVKDQDFTAEIHEPLTLDDITSNKLLRVRQFSQSGGDFDNWQKYAEEESNVGFDRYTELPFYLTVWVDEQAKQARLMLFSDHYMSDGYSGMVVFNCILEQVASLATQKDTPSEEFPLRPSFYDMWLSKKPVSKGLMKSVISLFGKAIYRSEMKKFTPVLPARADQRDFVVPPVSNPTSATFAQGDPSSMSKALAKCKDEGVTFGGAVVCATLLAFYHAAKKLPTFDSTKPFKIVTDLDYNMRRRVPQQFEEDSVGSYVAFSDLGWLASEGVNLKTTKFWDLARRAKREIDAKLHQTMMMAAVPIILDQRINAEIQPSFAKALNIRHSQTSDANLSNVGRYPFAKEHSISLGDSEKSVLTVKSLHVYNPLPHLGPSAVLWVSSVDSFCYSMGHKCEDNLATALFTAWVAVCENIGNIETDETLTGVLDNMNL
ncbi:Hypothetical protein PHPALM_37179 [Phytophthora palmivora]|uniref:Condensation domain-containing protein n=1 Tax=Phytophthora palmivora TaxID=4796 RepID=A0A2P4WY33_9STRA|nr:Hypothetical protein PHPALM_37179 [Phytophthora palmivora]